MRAILACTWIATAALLMSCDPPEERAPAANEVAGNADGEGGSSRGRSEVGDLNLSAEMPESFNGVAELTPSECEELGGTVFYAPGCEGTLLGCRAAGEGRYARCIDERDPQRNGVE